MTAFAITPASSGRALAGVVRSLTPMPLRYLVLTHWHVDHTLGAAGVLADHQNVNVFAHDVSPAGITAPTRIDLGGVELELIPVSAHTAGDLIVHVPGERVLVSGDIRFDATASVSAEVAAALSGREFSWVLPGHGPPARASRTALSRVHQSDTVDSSRDHTVTRLQPLRK